MKCELIMDEFTLDDLFNELLAELQSFRSSADWLHEDGYELALWRTLERLYPRLMLNRALRNQAISKST
ncbi:hypothetical protein ACM43_15805 [Bradyrhizobium sp. CCBAU 45321]|nr:hypothetical protein [Bradyrhizobium sp. CCBAU 45321]